MKQRKVLFCLTSMLAVAALPVGLATANSQSPASSPTMVVYPAHAALPEASAVEALGQTWGQTLAGRNPQQIAALYSPEAVLLATFTNELDTAPEILEYFTGLTKREGLNVRFDEQNIRILDENTASNSGLYTFSFVEDGKTVSVPARYTFLYEKQGDQWLIEHHSSVRPEAAQ
jgi:uncharacterized protein (TIGR02246 family)